MKKTFSLVLGAVLLCAPLLASADTTNQTALENLYQQLITILTQELQSLVQAKQAAQTTPPIAPPQPPIPPIQTYTAPVQTTVAPINTTSSQLASLWQQYNQLVSEQNTCFANIPIVVGSNSTLGQMQQCNYLYTIPLSSVDSQISILEGNGPTPLYVPTPTPVPTETTCTTLGLDDGSGQGEITCY